MWKTRTAMSGAGDSPALTSATLGRNLPSGMDSVALSRNLGLFFQSGGLVVGSRTAYIGLRSGRRRVTLLSVGNRVSPRVVPASPLYDLLAFPAVISNRGLVSRPIEALQPPWRAYRAGGALPPWWKVSAALVLTGQAGAVYTVTRPRKRKGRCWPRGFLGSAFTPC